MAQLGCAACKSFGQRLIDNHLWSPNTHKTASRYAKWKKGKGSWFRCDILATLAHLLFKNFQGLGQCLSGHYHHKLVKIVFSWRIGLLCSLQKKVTCFRTFHSLQFCLVVLLSQKNSRATWLFYCYFILLGPQGVPDYSLLATPKKDLFSFMAFFSTLNWIIDEQLEEHFLWLPSFKYWPALEKKWSCFTGKDFGWR